MRLRAPTIEDAPAVLEVLVARQMADIGMPDYVLEDLYDEWRANEFDLAADARVVEIEGRLAAYAVTRGPGTLVAVAPDYEGRGIGARLLEWAERRDHELGRAAHLQWIGSGNERGRALLEAAGYGLARSYWRLGLRLEDLSEQPRAAPAGLTLRSLDVEHDDVTLHALDAQSFAGAADYHPESLQAFQDEHLGAHDLDPELSRVAEFGGEVVGFLLARRWTDAPVVFVDILAVRPDRQGQGIGTTLLIETFRLARAAGLEDAQLGVASTNPRALAVYERLGMTPRCRYDTYVQPARSATTADKSPASTPSNP
jgi:mycothiol synthase